MAYSKPLKNVDQTLINLPEFDNKKLKESVVNVTPGLFDEYTSLNNISSNTLPINTEHGHRMLVLRNPIIKKEHRIFRNMTEEQPQSPHSIKFENYPSSQWLLDQWFLELTEGFKQGQSEKIAEPLKNIEQLNAEIKQMLEQNIHGYPRNFEPAKNISLHDAIRLLPKSFDGNNTDELDIFLEKCEFAISCVVKGAIPRLLQVIRTRLTGKARQITKYKTIKTWQDLRKLMKSNLGPQRTTPQLYFELYASKQNLGENVFTYATKIEQLQKLIIEQETSEFKADIANAIETIIKRQVLQVFIEGLRDLKHFVKALHPLTLDIAIKVARDEEHIRHSNSKAKHYVYNNDKQNITVKCFNCGVKGHYAKNCILNTNPSSVSVYHVICNYCKIPGHKIDSCKKRILINSKRGAKIQQLKLSLNRSENYHQPEGEVACSSDYVREAINGLNSFSFAQSK